MTTTQVLKHLSTIRIASGGSTVFTRH